MAILTYEWKKCNLCIQYIYSAKSICSTKGEFNMSTKSIHMTRLFDFEWIVSYFMKHTLLTHRNKEATPCLYFNCDKLEIEMQT